MCAPQAFEEHQRARKRAAGWSWADARPRLWGLVGLVLCGLAAYTVLERNAPKIILVLIAALSLGALFKILPAKD
jgi:hypothetical protein